MAVGTVSNHWYDADERASFVHWRLVLGIGY